MSASRYAILGLSARGLRTQIVVARVRDIDVEKLRRAVGGKEGRIAAAAIPIADALPEQAIDAIIPFIREQLRGFGIDAEVSAASASPPPRARSEFLPGMAAGVGMLAIVGAIGWAVCKLVKVVR